jgi:hypothetical protein
MGMISAELGKNEQAGCYFGEALKNCEKKKNCEKVKNNRAHYWVEPYNEALTFYKSGAYDSAIEHADVAILIAPDSCRAYELKGSALINLSGYEDAIAPIEDGLEVCPNNEKLQEYLFVALHNLGNDIYDQAAKVEEDTTGQREQLYAEAVDWYTRASELRPDDLGNLYQRGAACLQLVMSGDTTRVDDGRECLLRFQELAEKKDDLQAAYYNLVLLEVEAEDLAKASEYADKYIGIDPKDVSGYRLRAGLSQQMGDSEAAQAFIIFFNSFSKGETIEDVNAWIGAGGYGSSSDLAKMVKEKGQPDEAHSYKDSSGNHMDSIFYWSKGEGFAFYGGQNRGAVRFPPVEADSEASEEAETP